ncbi:unnamed protein product [Vicia faba]|uniref:Uncharacterized protein n=1 Tax=Vicia faba TaxID=3906 RepID=A0AAV0YWM4_VICFA|nr:unnamed protein product [Vicia faba]
MRVYLLCNLSFATHSGRLLPAVPASSVAQFRPPPILANATPTSDQRSILAACILLLIARSSATPSSFPPVRINVHHHHHHHHLASFLFSIELVALSEFLHSLILLYGFVLSVWIGKTPIIKVKSLKKNHVHLHDSDSADDED